MWCSLNESSCWPNSLLGMGVRWPEEARLPWRWPGKSQKHADVGLPMMPVNMEQSMEKVLMVSLQCFEVPTEGIPHLKANKIAPAQKIISFVLDFRSWTPNQTTVFFRWPKAVLALRSQQRISSSMSAFAERWHPRCRRWCTYSRSYYRSSLTGDRTVRWCRLIQDILWKHLGQRIFSQMLQWVAWCWIGVSPLSTHIHKHCVLQDRLDWSSFLGWIQWNSTVPFAL